MKIYLLIGYIEGHYDTVLAAYESEDVADSTLKSCEEFKYVSSLHFCPGLPKNFRDFDELRIDKVELVK